MLWQLKQLSCGKCGEDRNNCVLSRRNWTRAKKRSVKEREIDLVHDPSARPDETQKSDRSDETSQ